MCVCAGARARLLYQYTGTLYGTLGESVRIGPQMHQKFAYF